MSESSPRAVVIRNPAISHAGNVQQEVMTPLYEAGLPGQIVEFPVPSTEIAESIEQLAEVLQPGDRLISPGGDGTGNLAANAAILSGQQNISIGFLAYGNFNDIAATFTGRGTRHNPAVLLTSPDVIEANPLQILKDGEHHRYALLYANLGWTAEAASLFDDPEIRRALQAGETSLPANLMRLAKSYFGERSNATLPDFRRDGEQEIHSSTTDVLAVNGPIMGKIIRSGKDYYRGGTFLSSELDISTLLRNAPFLGRSALNLLIKTHLTLPGSEVQSMELNFGDEQVDVPLQIDGEYELARVHSLSVAKDTAEGPAVNIIAA